MPMRPTLAAQQLDLALCLQLNRLHRRLNWVRLLRLVSWLGDGPIWYALALVLPLLYGSAALQAVGEMALVAIFGLLLYKTIKRLTGRERPCRAHPAIVQAAMALDRYSFPSGHTLHAVAFTTVAVAHFGELAWLLVPFTALVALSRPALGLHYPSDVLAGAALGGALGALSLQIL
jgi:undecaprenyl-diphosphatase